ncbi:TraB/GumN family protein [Altererythrobacter xixiisoli]|uniref:TraB/GumN family protein n=1 Tax=Croceibacterium xixiisoli TaxID=1476466 RepID=A0A6I4U026_9SPHN|nr:TraB/GumN family protein [Croceibacterium xixiisoli]MXO99973.1 TraB/GumN family protein [Croceibacterium xixiisoli]
MTVRRLFSTSAAALSLLLSACAGGWMDGKPPVTAVPGPALWKLADTDTTIYLFGTVHALPGNLDWYDARIARAFDASNEFVTEVDMSQPDKSTMALARAGALKGDRTLRDMMDSEHRLAYEAALVTLGKPIDMFDRVEPWLAAVTLSLLPLIQAGYDPASGVEQALKARANNKVHAALETVDQQVELFDGLPEAAQFAYLSQSVDAVPQAGSSLDAMVAEWKDGDMVALGNQLNGEIADPALYARLLTDRNAHWADWIEKRMEQDGTVFIAVGAGHLAGKDSVQAQLRKRGLKVERVWE